MRISQAEAERYLLRWIAKFGAVQSDEGALLKALVEQGYAERTGRSSLGTTYAITDAGRAALEQGQ